MFPFPHLHVWGFRLDMLYIDMKVAFETVYVVLSWSHSLSRFHAFVLMHLQKFPTNEPLWKWRGESQNHFVGGQWGKFMRMEFYSEWILILYVIKNTQVGKFHKHFLFKGNRCFMDRPTKVIWIIHNFKIFLESLDLFDMSWFTFFELFL